MKLSTSARSPLSPTRWPPDAFAWPRSLGGVVIVLAGFGVGLLADSIVLVRMGVTQADVVAQKLSWAILIGQLASYVPFVAALVLVLPQLARRTLAELGLRFPTAREALAGLAGAGIMYVVTIGAAEAQYALVHQAPHDAAETLFAGATNPGLTLAFGVLAVVIAPFVEELAYRGGLFNVFLRYAPAWAAAALSGIVFGLSHGSLSALFPLACGGAVLAYVYYTTGSLASSMIAHGLFNAVNLLLTEVVKRS